MTTCMSRWKRFRIKPKPTLSRRPSDLHDKSYLEYRVFFPKNVRFDNGSTRLEDTIVLMSSSGVYVGKQHEHLITPKSGYRSIPFPANFIRCTFFVPTRVAFVRPITSTRHHTNTRRPSIGFSCRLVFFPPIQL